jgi:hypothetical protein
LKEEKKRFYYAAHGEKTSHTNLKLGLIYFFLAENFRRPKNLEKMPVSVAHVLKE